MENEKVEKILDRIRKLFALAGNNPNEHEAASAAEMAKDLLEKYNLTISDIEMKEIIEKEIVLSTYNMISWKSWLSKVISDTFDTICYQAKSRYERKSKIVFVGTKTDVEVSVYVYEYLSGVIQRLIDKKIENKVSGVHGKTIKHNYTMGIIHVLRDRLKDFYGKQKEEKKEEKNAYGQTGKEIVVIKQDAIQKYLEAVGLTLKQKYSSHNIVNRSAYMDGMNDGNNINLSKGIGRNHEQATAYIN